MGGYLLRYRSGNEPWREYPIPVDCHQIVIGRSSDCDLPLDASNISRHHARLVFSAQGVVLTDLGSTNGTQMAGRPIQPRTPILLAPGQTFSVGSYVFMVAETRAQPISPVQPAKPPPAPAPVQSVQPPSPPPPSPSEVMPGTQLFSGDIQQVQIANYNLDLSQRDRFSIGRAPDNNIRLDHPQVSRYHAEIERIGGRIQLRDLRSSNGVYVNNQRLTAQVWLKDNDRIRIGPYEFTLHGLSLRPHAEEGLLLQAVNINKHVSRKLNLLQNINLTIRPMEFVAVVGMSGSGKTTLLNALSGFSPTTDGKVLVNGVDLYSHYDLFRNDMGYVPQKDIVHAELTPREALEYVAKLRMPPDTSPEERSQAVVSVLKELDLAERMDVPISSLSGGQLKRVSIGVELLTRPRLFFLDEPTSGLDPGTEYEMMRLLRRLADQGRTVMLVTHATKNVILCDKVIFLARGGNLAFFGPPDEALAYFDQYRTDRERTQKQMEFDDIYRILSDPKRGSPTEWNARFLTSPYYREAVIQGVKPSVPAARTPQRKLPVQNKRQVSSFRQFVILSARNLKILTKDKVSLALMLALAPGIGMMDMIWGNNLFDPKDGDATKIITMWFMSALITVLIGALSSVREIVKEADIYRRERSVNLKIVPYIFSKIWVGFVLALYQAGVLLLTRLIFNRPEMPGAGSYMALYITLFLCTLCGYLIGLVISASAPNQNAAMLLIIVVLVPQFLFAGALLPLDLIPGGEAISVIMPTRWAFESFVNITQMGQKVVDDACWADSNNVTKLTDAEKEKCTCMGINIFTKCSTFPGILDPDYYSAEIQAQISKPAPVEPAQPTAYPQPSPYPSFTPLPTPTLLPSLTPYPTPGSANNMGLYMNKRQDQGNQYQDMILNQFSEYRKQSEDQGGVYSDLRTKQGDQYADLRKQQGDQYKASMNSYADDRSAYEHARQKAVNSAESILKTIYDNYGRAFRGTAAQRWLILCGIMALLLGLLLFFQKRKDVI